MKHKSLRGMLTAALVGASLLATPASARLRVGVEPSIGAAQYTFNTPAENRTVSITGDTGLYDVPRIATYNLEVPSSVKVNGFDFSIGAFVANETEHTWQNFKIGKDFYSYGSGLLKGTDEFIARTSRSDFPAAAVTLDADTENVLYVEKQLLAGEDIDFFDLGGPNFSLIGRLNKNNWRMRGKTHRIPYGSEWSQSSSAVETSDKEIASGNGYNGYLGLRVGGNETKRLETNLEVGLGIPFDGALEPVWGARFSIGVKL